MVPESHIPTWSGFLGPDVTRNSSFISEIWQVGILVVQVEAVRMLKGNEFCLNETRGHGEQQGRSLLGDIGILKALFLSFTCIQFRPNIISTKLNITRKHWIISPRNKEVFRHTSPCRRSEYIRDWFTLAVLTTRTYNHSHNRNFIIVYISYEFILHETS